MDTALCWKAFEDDFIWLHGKSEDGLRAEGGRKGDDDKWRCQLAAAMREIFCTSKKLGPAYLFCRMAFVNTTYTLILTY